MDFFILDFPVLIFHLAAFKKSRGSTDERMVRPTLTIADMTESLAVGVEIDRNAASPFDEEDPRGQNELVSRPRAEEREAEVFEGEDTAIFDIAYECFSMFERIRTTQDEALTIMSFVTGDLSGAQPTNSSNPKRDFLGLRNSFAFWLDYTGALSLMESSLDARLRGLADISSMVVELLDMVLRNLRRRELSILIFPHDIRVLCHTVAHTSRPQLTTRWMTSQERLLQTQPN